MMALQLRRTTTNPGLTGPSPPSGLRDGQPAVEVHEHYGPNDVSGRLWVGVPPEIDPSERMLLNPGASLLPVVARVRITGWSMSPAAVPWCDVVLVLDRPAPANCFVQFWRRNRHGIVGKGDSSVPRLWTSGFRALGFDGSNNAGFAVRPIGVGATQVYCGQVRDLYRPTTLRHSNIGPGYSRYRREVPYAQQDLEIPPQYRSSTRDTKVVLKFGTVIRYRRPPENWMVWQRGPMSAETIRIKRWRYANQGYYHWGLKIDAL
jgi:hypothetical protein